MGKYIMALDQGTTSSRCILFDRQGTVISVAQKEFKQIYPKPGWVEHDPLEIWSSQLGVMMEAMGSVSVSIKEIEAIGITNQRETTIVWDKETGRPVYNAIVWQCRRTADQIEKLRADGMEELVRQRTGLIPDAYFSASKIAWILDHVEGAREKAECGELLFGTVDSWLIWKLTGGKVHVTDYTNASRTMLFDIEKLDWDQEILDYFKIPACMLPKVRPSSSVYGLTAAEVVGGEVPIAGAAGDQQAALFGQCCFGPGEVKNTYGTGCFLLMNTGERLVRSESGLLTTIAIGIDGRVEYALEGSVFVAGAAIQWLRDELRVLKNAAQSEEACRSVEDTGGVFVVPAFAGLGAPYWQQYARGTVVGITRGTTREHIIRAVVEALAYQVYDVVAAMEKDAGIPLKSLRADGGAAANNFLLQFQADLLNGVVVRPQCIETTALGAAYLAGLSVGYWKDREEVKKNWAVQREFVPQISAEKRSEQLKGWKRAVRSALSWAEEQTGQERQSGDRKNHENVSGNMKKIQFYICPICGNVITAVGEGQFSCCGVPLLKQEAEPADKSHGILVETIDDEYSVTMDHPMSKEHFISFIAYVTSGSVEIIKLYPEQDISVRFQKKGHGILYGYCNRHGLFQKNI